MHEKKVDRYYSSVYGNGSLKFNSNQKLFDHKRPEIEEEKKQMVILLI